MYRSSLLLGVDGLAPMHDLWQRLMLAAAGEGPHGITESNSVTNVAWGYVHRLSLQQHHWPSIQQWHLCMQRGPSPFSADWVKAIRDAAEYHYDWDVEDMLELLQDRNIMTEAMWYEFQERYGACCVNTLRPLPVVSPSYSPAPQQPTTSLSRRTAHSAQHHSTAHTPPHPTPPQGPATTQRTARSTQRHSTA